MCSMEMSSSNSTEKDSIDSYFECITSCSIEEEEIECVTRCVDIHLKDESE